MSLFRVLLILVVVIMILPIGNDVTAGRDTSAPQSNVSTGQFVDAAVSAAYDVSGICSRQPVVCSIGYELWTTFQRKSLYIANYVYDWANGATSSPSEQRPLQRRDESRIPPSTELMHGQAGTRNDRVNDLSNTLTDDDRALPWRGPAS